MDQNVPLRYDGIDGIERANACRGVIWKFGRYEPRGCRLVLRGMGEREIIGYFVFRHPSHIRTRSWLDEGNEFGIRPDSPVVTGLEPSWNVPPPGQQLVFVDRLKNLFIVCYSFSLYYLPGTSARVTEYE